MRTLPLGFACCLSAVSTVYANNVDQIQQYITNNSSSEILVDMCTLYKCTGKNKCETFCYTNYKIRSGQTVVWKKCKVPNECGVMSSTHAWIYDEFKRKSDGPFPEQDNDDLLYFRVQWHNSWFQKYGYSKALYVSSPADTSLYWIVSGSYYKDLPKVKKNAY